MVLIFVICHPLPTYSDNKFTFDYDYCLFRNDDSKIVLEFYYSFYQNQLKFIKTENGYEADGMIDLEVVDKSINMPVIQKTYKVPIAVPDTAGYNKSSKLTGQINMLLDSGSYTFHIKAADFNDTLNYINYDKDVDIRAFDPKNVASSWLQFASGIRKSSDQQNIFYKNTLEVVPNPSRLIGNNLSELYYYTEFYNLNKTNLTDDYSITTLVTDLNDSVFKSNSKNYKLKNESRVEYGQMNVSDLKTGIYKLTIRLVDAKNTVRTESRSQFVIYNTDTSAVTVNNATDKDFYSSEYADYPEEKLDQEFEHAGYIMSDVFRKQYSNTNDLNAKRKLMFGFWKSLDPNPLTQLNEFKQEYLKRIDYANKNFKGDYTDGWKTDRGRVYAVYGMYDDIDRHPFESSTRGYEIWKYDKLQGGVIFVFIDISNQSGDYILVHSTARNELRDDDWQRRLNIKR